MTCEFVLSNLELKLAQGARLEGCLSCLVREESGLNEDSGHRDGETSMDPSK